MDLTTGEFALALLASSPDGLILATADGDIAYASEQTGVLFGCGVDQLVGLPVDELVPQPLRHAHQTHRAGYRDHPTVRAMGVGRELLALRRDGSTFYAEISLSPLTLDGENFVVAAVRDVSDRVMAEDHLHRVLQALDSTDDAIMVFDAETLRYSHVNEGAVRMLGYDRARFTTMTPADLNPHSDEADYRHIVAELLAHPEVSMRREARLLAFDGHEIPVEKLYRAAPVARDGTRWIIAVARDVTARLDAEAELDANRAALRDAEHNMLLADDRARIARDLHDTVIQRLFGAGLRLQSISAATDERVRDRLEETIDDLDDTIRELRSTIFSLHTGQQRTTGLRGQLLELISEAGANTGIEARLQFDGPIDNLDPTIAAALVPTLREALSNVAKHARARHVHVSVSAQDSVELVVADDGVGITGEVLGGHGLVNLRDRARELGGDAELVAGDGGGCELRWTVPNR